MCFLRKELPTLQNARLPDNEASFPAIAHSHRHVFGELAFTIDNGQSPIGKLKRERRGVPHNHLVSGSARYIGLLAIRATKLHTNSTTRIVNTHSVDPITSMPAILSGSPVGARVSSGVTLPKM